VVEKIVEIPMDKYVEKRVEVFVEKYIEKIVHIRKDVLVEKVVEVQVDEEIVEVPMVNEEYVVESTAPRRITLEDQGYMAPMGRIVVDQPTIQLRDEPSIIYSDRLYDRGQLVVEDRGARRYEGGTIVVAGGYDRGLVEDNARGSRLRYERDGGAIIVDGGAYDRGAVYVDDGARAGSRVRYDGGSVVLDGGYIDSGSRSRYDREGTVGVDGRYGDTYYDGYSTPTRHSYVRAA